MSQPDISIVVCTQNRAEMLRGALASLYDLAICGFTYEIVVIDNGSRDHTQQVTSAAAIESKHPLRGVLEPDKGIVPARNRGIREARGRWIASFDDDQLADSRWLAELYRGANEKRCRVVGGSVRLSFPEGCARRLDPTVRMLLGEAKLGDEPQPYGGRLTPGCGNLMIERSVFDEVGVFERTVDGRGEDTDLFSRIEQAGIAAWYFPSAIVHHLTPPERLADAYLLNLARRMGAGIAQRQAAQFSRGRFVALWLAKALRLSIVQAPKFALATLRGDREAALGCRCMLAINASFLSARVSAVRGQPRTSSPHRRWGLIQTKPKTASP
jgi:glycosyltransferase involved in cell wall biosynthesis